MLAYLRANPAILEDENFRQHILSLDDDFQLDFISDFPNFAPAGYDFIRQLLSNRHDGEDLLVAVYSGLALLKIGTDLDEGRGLESGVDSFAETALANLDEIVRSGSSSQKVRLAGLIADFNEVGLDWAEQMVQAEERDVHLDMSLLRSFTQRILFNIHEEEEASNYTPQQHQRAMSIVENIFAQYELSELSDADKSTLIQSFFLFPSELIENLSNSLEDSPAARRESLRVLIAVSSFTDQFIGEETRGEVDLDELANSARALLESSLLANQQSEEFLEVAPLFYSLASDEFKQAAKARLSEMSETDQALFEQRLSVAQDHLDELFEVADANDLTYWDIMGLFVL